MPHVNERSYVSAPAPDLKSAPPPTILQETLRVQEDAAGMLCTTISTNSTTSEPQDGGLTMTKSITPAPEADAIEAEKPPIDAGAPNSPDEAYTLAGAVMAAATADPAASLPSHEAGDVVADDADAGGQEDAAAETQAKADADAAAAPKPKARAQPRAAPKPDVQKLAYLAGVITQLNITGHRLGLMDELYNLHGLIVLRDHEADTHALDLAGIVTDPAHSLELALENWANAARRTIAAAA